VKWSACHERTVPCRPGPEASVRWSPGCPRGRCTGRSRATVPETSACRSVDSRRRPWKRAVRVDLIPRRGCPPRFVPPSPFLTTLTVYPSPAPSGMFHPVTLVGFSFRSGYQPEELASVAARRLRHPRYPGQRNEPTRVKVTEATLRPPTSWQARSARSVSSTGQVSPGCLALCQTSSRLTKSNA
jgi:hypothetical protein